MHDILWQIIAAAWMCLGVVWFAAAFLTKRTVKRQSATGRIIQAVMMVAVFYLLFGNASTLGALQFRVEPMSQAVGIVATFFTLVGIGVALIARLFLGRNWSSVPTVKQGHELIRTGPYSIVRHPIYSGLLLAILGTAVYLGELRGFISLAIATIAWKWKSLTEEGFMREQFGPEYDHYRQQVKAIIPFVW